MKQFLECKNKMFRKCIKFDLTDTPMWASSILAILAVLVHPPTQECEQQTDQRGETEKETGTAAQVAAEWRIWQERKMAKSTETNGGKEQESISPCFLTPTPKQTPKWIVSEDYKESKKVKLQVIGEKEMKCHHELSVELQCTLA